MTVGAVETGICMSTESEIMNDPHFRLRPLQHTMTGDTVAFIRLLVRSYPRGTLSRGD